MIALRIDGNAMNLFNRYLNEFSMRNRTPWFWLGGLFIAAVALWNQGFRPAHAQQPFSAEPMATLSRLAFGSCAKQDRPQLIWDAVIETKPQLFLFLGDNIYGDTQDMQVLREKWNLLGAQPGYQRLKETCPILATWDDHDYGANDAGADYPKKRESQQIFDDFFGVPADCTRRKHEGVYHAQVFGPPGKRVQIILLDVRYFRSPLVKGFKPGEPGDGYRGVYLPNEDPAATILGEAQWKWLAAQLREPAELRLICSGTKILPDEHGSKCWGNFPRERKKLFQTIRESQANGVVLLSGDRHLAEVMKLGPEEAGTGYPLYEVTSSSLNAPSGNLTKAGVRFANEINRYRVGLTYFDINFGNVMIDWEQADPHVRVQVREEKGSGRASAADFAQPTATSAALRQQVTMEINIRSVVVLLAVCLIGLQTRAGADDPLRAGIARVEITDCQGGRCLALCQRPAVGPTAAAWRFA